MRKRPFYKPFLHPSLFLNLPTHTITNVYRGSKPDTTESILTNQGAAWERVFSPGAPPATGGAGGKKSDCYQRGHAAVDAEFFVERLDLVAHGVNAGAERGGDFLGLRVACEQGDDLRFARGECRRRRAGDWRQMAGDASILSGWLWGRATAESRRESRAAEDSAEVTVSPLGSESEKGT